MISLLGKKEFKQKEQEHQSQYRDSERILYELLHEKTGMDCARWLAHLCVERKVPVPLYYIHTLNPIGRQNIFSILESARKMLTESK